MYLQITDTHHTEEEGFRRRRYTCETGKQHSDKRVAANAEPGSDHFTAINDSSIRKKRRGSNFH